MLAMVKDYNEWKEKKAELNSYVGTPPQVRAGDIWWASVGDNIGSEINGKGELFSRPFLILKVTGNGFYFGIPLSTRIKFNKQYIFLKSGTKDAVACLHQSQAIDFRRLSDRITTVSNDELDRIRKAFLEYYSI
jgi:mRNA interferase MazF